MPKPTATSGELPRPVQDNTRVAQKKESKAKALPNEGKPSQSPQATSMVGSLSIIKDVGMRKNGGIHGIPGIISSTVTSPETRQRLVSGILDPMSGSTPQGPVHSVMGHDSTAYNAGSVHIRGSSFK